MRKSTLDKLEEIYQTGDFDNPTNKCKFFALFAFGQVYSIRSESKSVSRVPGTAYFARAMSLVQILPERTSITHLETLLLLVGCPVVCNASSHSNFLSPCSHITSIVATQHMYLAEMPCAWA